MLNLNILNYGIYVFSCFTRTSTLNQPGIQHCLGGTDKALCDLSRQLNLPNIMRNVDVQGSTLIYESSHPRVIQRGNPADFDYVKYTVSVPNIFYYSISFDPQTTVYPGN